MLNEDRNRSLAVGAALGFAAGLATNLVRKGIVQAPTAVAGRWDEALATEHAMTLKLFDAVQNSSDGQTAKRSMLLMQIKHALAKHAFQEENVVYAALRNHGQTEAADHLNHDHGYVKQYLYDLTEIPKNDPQWLTKVAEFRALLEKHMREEEDVVFPKMRSALTVEQNRELTFAMNKEGLKLA